MLEISVYLPETILSNEQLSLEFPSWDYNKIQTKIGIKNRHVTDRNETALDLAFNASEKLFTKFDRTLIDFLILCTQSPDYFLPTTACILQDRLHLTKTIGAFDYNLGCSGYIYGLAIAKGLLSSEVSENLLLVTSETYSKHLNKKDVANRAIFGDGATATLLRKSDYSKVGKFTLGTDGSGKDNLIVRNGGLRNPFEANAREIQYGNENYYTNNNLYMNGPEIFNFTIENVPDLVRTNLKVNNSSIDKVDYFVFHQANQFMLDYLRKKIGIPIEKFCVDFENYGNTVSNTIPIVLKNGLDSGKIKSGHKVMLVGFGVGYSWGAVIIEI